MNQVYYFLCSKKYPDRIVCADPFRNMQVARQSRAFLGHLDTIIRPVSVTFNFFSGDVITGDTFDD